MTFGVANIDRADLINNVALIANVGMESRRNPAFISCATRRAR